MLIGYAFCFGMPLRNSVRVMILAASPLATIFCNVVRILPTIWIYGNYEPKVGVVFHSYSGWLMLPISFLMLLGLIKVLRLGHDSRDAIYFGLLSELDYTADNHSADSRHIILYRLV